MHLQMLLILGPFVFSTTENCVLSYTTKTIFDAYYQQKEKNVGFGLGLSIVKDICNKYKIDINVTSINNQTSFSYFFPKNLLIKEDVI